MMVDRRTLDRPRGEGLLSALSAFDVIAFDARGHGESIPRADQGARYTYDDIVRFDVPAMIARGREIARGRKLVVVGHSLIGHAAMIAAGMGHAPDAIVAYAPNLWAPHLEPSLAMRAIKAAMLASWAASATIPGWFDSRRFRMGTEPLAAAYVDQFLSMWIHDRLRGEDDYEAALGRVDVPILAYSSTNDRVLARPPAVERFLALMPRARVEHHIVPDVDHMGFVLDRRARAIWEETARWITAL
jgi:predicted alpha/beta hydrolase